VRHTQEQLDPLTPVSLRDRWFQRNMRTPEAITAPEVVVDSLAAKSSTAP
jgi:hypothetical protein